MILELENQAHPRATMPGRIRVHEESLQRRPGSVDRRCSLADGTRWEQRRVRLPDGHADGDPHSDQHLNVDADFNVHGDSDLHVDEHADEYADSDEHADRDLDRHGHRIGDRHDRDLQLADRIG